MPNVITQTQLVSPTNGTQSFSLQDLEIGKFILTDGTVSIRMASAGTVNIGTVVGNVASGTTDSGNPIKVGGVYNTSAPTLTNGQRGDLQVDVNSNLKTVEQYAAGAEDNTNGLLATLMKPVASSTYSPTDHTNFGAAAGTGVLIKGSAGNVFSCYVTSGTSAVRYFQLFNQATVPVVGQTPVASYPLGSVVAGNLYELKLDSSHFAPSKHFSTGIAAAISSTSGTLGTASITITDYTWHIKYI